MIYDVLLDAFRGLITRGQASVIVVCAAWERKHEESTQFLQPQLIAEAMS